MDDRIKNVYAMANRWCDEAERWEALAKRAQRTTVRALGLAFAMLALALITVAVLPVKAPVMFARAMAVQVIHCPSEDGGLPHCVWDTWTDGNGGQGDPDGPRWLVWP